VPPIKFILIPFLLLNASLSLGLSVSELDLIDVPLPFCEVPRVFSQSSQEGFVEIQNILPGKNAYNQLVEDYQRRRWSRFDTGVQGFKKDFSTSPLIEAVDFLDFQAELDRQDREKPEALVHIEKHFRELYLLYPKSHFIPFIQLSFANLLLEFGSSQKALGLFREGRERFSFHSQSCFFIYGEAEAEFQLAFLSEAKKTFQAITQKCKNPKLVTASQIRLVDIERKESGEKRYQKQKYEKIRENQSALVARFFPDLLLNLAEIAYREKSSEQSLFFLNDFFRATQKQHLCMERAQKRKADLVLRKEQEPSKAVGEYLELAEQSPKSDLGRFSKVVASLLDSKDLGEGEFARREISVTNEIKEIKDKRLNLNARILRSLAYLERQNTDELESLKTLKENNPSVFTQNLSDEIFSKLMIIQGEKLKQKQDLTKKTWESWFWESTYQVFTDWFKNKPEESKFKRLVSAQVMELSDRYIASDDFTYLIRNIKTWVQSDLFETSLANPKSKEKLSTDIILAWLKKDSENQKILASLFLENEEVLGKVFSPEGAFLWVQAAKNLDNKKKLEWAVKAINLQRKPAAGSKIPSELYRSAENLVVGQGLTALGDFKQADRRLASVRSPEFLAMSQLARVKNADREKKYKLAIEMGLKYMKDISSPVVKEMLYLVRDSIQLGKEWGYVEKVFSVSNRLELSPSEKLDFLNLRARSQLELGNYSKASETYKESLRNSPEQKNLAETQYYLGRALWKLGKTGQAKEQFKKVTEMNNDFWSALAENEIKVMGKNESN